MEELNCGIVSHVSKENKILSILLTQLSPGPPRNIFELLINNDRCNIYNLLTSE